MSVTSIAFLVSLLVVAAVFFFLPRGRARRLVLALCSLIFLATQIPTPASWVVMALFVLSGYAAGVWARSSPPGTARKWIVTTYIVLLLAVFVVLKEYQFLQFLIPRGTITRWVGIVGLSYMLFRQIHFVVDASEDQITHPSLWTYLNYQLNLFTLLAGPIQRYEDFARDWDSTAPVLVDGHARRKAIARLLIGILEVTVLGTAAQKLAAREVSHQLYLRSPHDILRFAIFFYAYPAYIYFNFSGYCDVVIAGASLVSLSLPENFNQPYLSRNVIDFWGRWHMTLTHWIRDYIFTPLYKAGIQRQVMRPSYLSYLCFFIALFLAGMWHGSSWNFAVFGLLHGAAVSINKMWEERIIRKRGRPGFRQYMKSPGIRAVSIFMTIQFVCFAFLFFPPQLNARLVFLKRFLLAKPPVARSSVIPEAR
jgi:D-alanyl-lipoteichoic acid acyltransferase DltB (MBOAT superfamily)